MHRHCILCQSENLSTRYLLKGFHILQCGKCSLVFVGEQLSQEELIPYYEAQEMDGFIYSEAANRANLEFYYTKIVDSILKRVPQGRILDVGCSSGYFLDGMKVHGWECHGIEMDARYARQASAKHGDAIYSGSLEEYACEENFFDVISLQDVLDHFSDPLQGLRKCHALLKPGGLLIVKVHDISSLYAKLTGPKYYALLPPLHLVYFSRKTLLAALTQSGFKVEGHQYFSHLLFLKTVLHWLMPADKKSLRYRFLERLGDSFWGKLKIRKNLRDIVTVFAVKA